MIFVGSAIRVCVWLEYGDGVSQTENSDGQALGGCQVGDYAGDCVEIKHAEAPSVS